LDHQDFFIPVMLANQTK